jgi:hypothetical protein
VNGNYAVELTDSSSNSAVETSDCKRLLTASNCNNAVEICNFEVLLTDIGGNYTEEGINEVTQLALCSCLFLCDHL